MIRMRNPTSSITYIVCYILQGVFVKTLKIVWMFNPFLNQLHDCCYWNFHLVVCVEERSDLISC